MGELGLSVDAFGVGFKAYLLGDDRNFRVTREDGFEEEMEVAPYFTGFPKYEKDSMQYVKGRVLDVGCGAGRVALWLQLRGFDVTGIDASPIAIEVCRTRGLTKCLVMPVEKLTFPPAGLDSVLMMGNNLGLAGTVPGTIELLKKLHTVTAPEGRIIASGRDPYKTDKPEHLAYHERNRRDGRPAGQIRLQVHFGSAKTDWFNLLLVSISELREIADKAGWKIERTFEGETGTYVAVLMKRA